MRKLLITAPGFLLSAIIAITSISSIAYAYKSNESSPILLKASEITFRPSSDYPKGTQIAVLRGDMNLAGTYSMRLQLSDRTLIPPHWHDQDEQITVISGTLYVGMGDTVNREQATALTAGSFQVIPAMVHHYSFAAGETVIQLDGTGPSSTTFVDPNGSSLHG